METDEAVRTTAPVTVFQTEFTGTVARSSAFACTAISIADRGVAISRIANPRRETAGDLLVWVPRNKIAVMPVRKFLRLRRQSGLMDCRVFRREDGASRLRPAMTAEDCAVVAKG
ncbi:MAG: hypothetical protein WB036_04795, partial [Pseudolabrys sp.]